MKFIDLLFAPRRLLKDKWDYFHWNKSGLNVYFFEEKKDKYFSDKISFELNNLITTKRIDSIYLSGYSGKISFESIENNFLNKKVFDFEDFYFYGVDSLNLLDNQKDFENFYNKLKSYPTYSGKKEDLRDSLQTVNDFFRIRSEKAVEKTYLDMEKNNFNSAALIFENTQKNFVLDSLKEKGLGFAEYSFDY